MPVFRTQVRLAFLAGSGGGTNTWHVRTNGALVGGQISEIRSALLAFYTGVAAVLPTSHVTTWDGYFLEIATGDPQVQETGATFSVPGTQSAQYSAAANMACVSWRSNLNARRGRGRTFIGPLHSSAIQTDGTLSPTALTAVRGAAQGLVSTSASANGWAVGVWSEKDGVLRDVASSSVVDQVAILRSRR